MNKTHKEITVQDCIELKEKFDKYTETAEQHEFVILAMVDMRLTNSINIITETNKVKDQKEARAMFRTVLKVIGKDYSEYEE